MVEITLVTTMDQADWAGTHAEMRWLLLLTSSTCGLCVSMWPPLTNPKKMPNSASQMLPSRDP